jgi:acyl-CoA synthetase (AMP-forming)/AMP-acid ligase II
MSHPLKLEAQAGAPSIAMVFSRLAARGDGALLWTPAGEASAAQVLHRAIWQKALLRKVGIAAGAVCAFEGDFAPETVAIFLALAALGAVAVPLTAAASAQRDELASTAGVEWWIDPASGVAKPAATGRPQRHALLEGLMAADHPGLVVFTSGSTGKPKAILHDMDRVASKFMTQRPGRRMIMFLLMDHFGGFNTLMSVLANDGVGICPAERTPRAVCEAVENGHADLLPTTPTFLGMMIASGLWRAHDLSSIKLVTYGAEPMPPATLARMREILPNAEFKQTYGLSELGVLRSSSPDQGSLWLKIGGEGFETRIVEGQLHVRSISNMLGYLNAPTPIDDEGWMNTGDLVEEKEGLIRFLGRRSEIINVGGQKVLPSEIEDVLLEAEGVAGAVVQGVPHPLLGQAVAARVALTRPEALKVLTQRLREHCRERLQKYKVPMRFEIVSADSITTPRAKKNRN